MKYLLTIALLIVGFDWSGEAVGQEENLRYELGKRVRNYELLWESSSPDRRALSTNAMERAVQEFFRLDLAAAAKSIDDAWFAMLPAPSELNRYAASLSMASAEILIDARSPTLMLTLKELYPQPPHAWAQGAYLALHLRSNSTNPKTLQTKEVSIQSLPIEIEWKLEGVEPGDFQLSATIHEKEMIGPIHDIQISIIKDKLDRIQAIESWVEENKRTEKTSTLCTARMMGRQILLANRSKPFECDLPFSSWFQEFESMAFSPLDLQPRRPNGRWQVLTDRKVEQVLRLQMPIKPTEKTTVIFALHGAGGSENMFFESYGAGRLIELARSRNWLVVSPRQGLTGLNIPVQSMIPILEKELGLSFDKVFLVGHSMGAAQAIEQVSRSQERITAVAAIGGGGNARKTEAFTKIPFYVSAGERDFGRGGAKRLGESLRSFGCEVVYSEYKDVEHLTIVQACLDELFRFLDGK